MKHLLLIFALLFSLTSQAQVNTPVLHYDTAYHWNYCNIVFPNDSTSFITFAVSKADTGYFFNWYLYNTQLTGSVPFYSKNILYSQSDYTPPLVVVMDSFYINYGINFSTY